MNIFGLRFKVGLEISKLMYTMTFLKIVIFLRSDIRTISKWLGHMKLQAEWFNCDLSFAGLHYCKMMHYPLIKPFAFGTLSTVSFSTRPLHIRPYYHFSALAGWISLNLWFTTWLCILSPGNIWYFLETFLFFTNWCWYLYLVGKETEDTGKQ